MLIWLLPSPSPSPSPGFSHALFPIHVKLPHLVSLCMTRMCTYGVACPLSMVTTCVSSDMEQLLWKRREKNGIEKLQPSMVQGSSLGIQKDPASQWGQTLPSQLSQSGWDFLDHPISHISSYTKKITAIFDLPVENVRKQDCTHVNHHQLDDPLPFIIMYTQLPIILVYVILKGWGYLIGSSLQWGGCVLSLSLFSKSIQ